MFGPNLRTAKSELKAIDTKATTELGSLPGGPIGVALGIEYRDESIEDTIKDLGAYCLLWLARPKDDQKAEDFFYDKPGKKEERPPKLAKQCQECRLYKSGECEGQEAEGCHPAFENASP
jgi:hypothetical protein